LCRHSEGHCTKDNDGIRSQATELHIVISLKNEVEKKFSIHFKNSITFAIRTLVHKHFYLSAIAAFS